MNHKQLAKKYYNSRVACQVLACLLEKPSLVKNRELMLSTNDFINPLHQLIFGVVIDLANKGVSSIRLVDIETHLNTVSPLSAKQFADHQGGEWVEQIHELCELDNYEYYHSLLRKLTCLRQYILNGFDVSELLDYTNVDMEEVGKQEREFFKMSLDDIIAFFDRKAIQSKKEFVSTSTESGTIGEGAEERYQSLLNQSPYGFSFESEYLNTIVRGLRRKALYIESRDSGTGKKICHLY